MKHEASVHKQERDANAPALLDARAAAAYLVVNIETLYRMVRAGELPHTRVGRALRFRQADLERYLAEQTSTYWHRGEGRKEDQSQLSYGEGDAAMTREKFLEKRKLEWLKQERRDFIDAYTEEWESKGWIAEWDEKEQALRQQWRVEHPDGTEEDWDEWVNRQLLMWQEERRAVLRDEAQEKWSKQAAEYERRWAAYVKDNESALLKEFAK
jgi:excisionase family DNA binding protein